MEQTSKLPRVAMGSCLIESLQSASPLKIQFKRGYEEKDCVKLVLAPDELRCAMEGGESICFKGTRGKSDAVICTGAKTFRLKKVETSNSVLVAPSLPAHDSGVYEVVAKSSHYYETTLSKPECEDLIEILKGSEYRGYEEEGDISFHSKSTLYTEKQLGDMILCSEDELRRMLKVVGAIDIDGYMRLCSHQALHDLNAVLINTIIEKDWDTRNISREKCVAEISNVDILVLDHALGRLGEKNPDGNTWTLFEKNLACAVAHLILKETREGAFACVSIINPILSYQLILFMSLTSRSRRIHVVVAFKNSG